MENTETLQLHSSIYNEPLTAFMLWFSYILHLHALQTPPENAVSFALKSIMYFKEIKRENSLLYLSR